MAKSVETLVAVYKAMALASGNDWHIRNAIEHEQVMLEGGVYDLNATKAAVQLLAKQLFEAVDKGV